MTTTVVAGLLWLAGMHGVVAFVIGAVFAQSSSTIIDRQLAEQGEDATPHGRLGLAISVFQDVTAVPILILIPVLGTASGMDALAAWRTALLLAVGGEFGFALLAIALDASVINPQTGQIVLNAVLFSMIGGILLIRYNRAIATRLAATPVVARSLADQLAGFPAPRVLIGGYGRVGHTIAVLLKSSGVDFVAFDTDPKRVLQGQADGHAVLYGDIADPELLTAARAEQASLAIITVDAHAVALRAVAALRQHCSRVPVIARARDLEASSALIEAGAIHAYPETIEASLRLGATALRMLQIPTADIDLMLKDIRDWDYQPVIENPVKEDAK